jgi:predicted ester cyclase
MSYWKNSIPVPEQLSQYALFRSEKFGPNPSDVSPLPIPGERVRPGAALASDCQETVQGGSIRPTTTDRRYGLMADPKHVVERHVQAFNARDADAEPWSDDGELVAPNASMHGREQVLGFLGVFWDAFPDGRLETSRLLAEGSIVAAEGRFIGKHTGVMRTPAGDVAATGRNVDLRWMSSYQVRGDELASEHLYFDQAELLGQLGLMPAT